MFHKNLLRNFKKYVFKAGCPSESKDALSKNFSFHYKVYTWQCGHFGGLLNVQGQQHLGERLVECNMTSTTFILLHKGKALDMTPNNDDNKWNNLLNFVLDISRHDLLTANEASTLNVAFKYGRVYVKKPLQQLNLMRNVWHGI